MDDMTIFVLKTHKFGMISTINHSRIYNPLDISNSKYSRILLISVIKETPNK